MAGSRLRGGTPRYPVATYLTLEVPWVKETKKKTMTNQNRDGTLVNPQHFGYCTGLSPSSPVGFKVRVLIPSVPIDLRRKTHIFFRTQRDSSCFPIPSEAKLAMSVAAEPCGGKQQQNTYSRNSAEREV